MNAAHPPEDTWGANLDARANQLADRVAKAIERAAQQYHSEADFRREAAAILGDAASEAGLEIVPGDEFVVACGRVDALYNRLVLEYKRPGILHKSNSHSANRAVIAQLKGYILDVAAREHRDVSRLAGVAIDGHYLVFVRRVGNGWNVDDPRPLTAASVELLLRLLFSLSSGVALVPENLVEDFGPATLTAQRAVRSLYAALSSSKDPLVQKLFEQWAEFFSEATDFTEWHERIEGKPEFQRFVTGIGLDPRYALAPRVFFAIHTYYALLIKLVASIASARFAGRGAKPLSSLTGATGQELHDAMKDVEDGGMFRQYGLRNFLEGDFFGWYLHAWTPEVAGAVASLIARLSQYDPATIELAPEHARDLLKKLYHYLLPREIRHDLGEYYTPDWLAERLLQQTLGDAALGDATKRVLDPACGSGTFLVLVIREVKTAAERRGDDLAATLRLILENIVGFDLNPLAVIAARTNYVLAIGDLLRHADGEIDIPVYQADSVMTPAQGEGLWEGSTYLLPTTVGELKVHESFATRERIDGLTDELDEAVSSAVSDITFYNRVKRRCGLSDGEAEAARDVTVALYLQLRGFHDQGLNGVWARIIKNAFAPLFLEPCHFVIGNPPWVNWEHLPDAYRQRSIRLWQHYGLFAQRGMDTILGGGKKDIAMLMTYVSADRYLRRGGKLGFVITQSVFKSAGAGQGFRRFRLPDGTGVGPLSVDDMSSLQPFEGATNRTAVIVLAKGRPVRYPVTYQRWYRTGRGRGSSLGFDTPLDEIVAGRASYRQWVATPVADDDPTSAWITGPPKALRAVKRVLGASHYHARAGSFTGGANAVYWLEIVGSRPGGLVMVTNITEGARRQVRRTQAAVEESLVYPLLRGRDVQPWSATPSASILMAQDPAERRGISVERMERDFPRAHAYLARFERELRARRDRGTRNLIDQGAPYWSMFSVGPYTLADWKVVWREQAANLTVAVVGPRDGRPVVPDHKLMLVEVNSEDEAHYLCAALGSSPARFVVSSYAVSIQVSTHVLKHVAVPRFLPRDSLHKRLSQVSRNLHEAVGAEDASRRAELEAELDKLAASLFGISDDELAEIQQALSR